MARESAAYRAVHLRLSVVQVLFAAWLLAATSSVVWLTVPIFVAMLALILTSLGRVRSSGGADRLALGLLSGTLGIYAGWSTAAVWINVASLLPKAGFSPNGWTGTAWQSAFLVGACLTAVLVIRNLAAPLPYVAAVGWAFIGVVVSAATADVPELAAVAMVGLVVVAAAARRTRRRPAASGPMPAVVTGNQ